MTKPYIATVRRDCVGTGNYLSPEIGEISFLAESGFASSKNTSEPVGIGKVYDTWTSADASGNN